MDLEDLPEPPRGPCATTLPKTASGKPPRKASHTMHKVAKSQNLPGNTYNRLR